MKRIIEESESDNFKTLKPLFGTSAQAPFYDPNDLHNHIWHYGKLGIEEDPKSPEYSKSKMSVKNCTYCKVCHKIKLDFQSSVSSNKDIVNDLLYDVFDSKFKDDYVSEHNKKIELNVHECIKNSDSELNENERIVSQNLFMKPEVVSTNYVIVKDLNNS